MSVASIDPSFRFLFLDRSNDAMEEDEIPAAESAEALSQDRCVTCTLSVA